MTKICQKIRFFVTFLTNVFKQNINVSKMQQRSQLCYIFVTISLWMFPKMFYFYNKNVTKTVKTLILLRFWIHFWNLFCQILNTFCILSDICDTYVDILSHFWQLFVTFLYFVTFLTVYCYIFITFLKCWDLH